MARTILAALLLSGALAACVSGRAAKAPQPSLAATAQLASIEPSASPRPVADSRPPVNRLVAFVSDAAGLNDFGLNALAVQGTTSAASRLGLPAPLLLNSAEPSEYARNLESAAAQAGLVLAIGPEMLDAVQAAAAAHPAVDFTLIGASPRTAQLDNVRYAGFRTGQAAYLAGVLAGGMAGKGNAAFIGGRDTPDSRSLLAAYEAGVHYGDPSARLLTRFAGDDTDQAAGKRLAQTLIGQGADVLFSGSFVLSLGVIAAASQLRVLAIGIDRDEFDVAPNAVLSSAIKRTDTAAELSIQDYVEGHFAGGVQELGIAEDGVGLAPLNELAARVPQGVEQALQEARARASVKS